MEVAFLISLRHRIHSLKLNLNGRMAGSTRVCLMVLMLLPLVSKQWIISANENTYNTVPLTGDSKLCELAVHKTGSTGLFAVSMRDAGNDKCYIVSNNGTDSASYWVGIFM